MLFHTHQWVEHERFYAPPLAGELNLTGCSEKLVEELRFGVTTILYRCKLCSEVKIIEILGRKQ
jgi:hypothetical protein